jgi:hypothetical protein
MLSFPEERIYGRSDSVAMEAYAEVNRAASAADV